MERETYSIADIARETRIPESTLRYYRDKFPHYFRGYGEGRNKRFDKEAFRVFTTIKQLFDENLTAEQVEHRLNDLFQQILEVPSEEAQHRSNSLAPLMQGMMPLLQSFVQSQNRVSDAIEGQTKVIETQHTTIQRLMEELKAVKQSKELEESLKKAEAQLAELTQEREVLLRELARPISVWEALRGRRRGLIYEPQQVTKEHAPTRAKHKREAQHAQ